MGGVRTNFYYDIMSINPEVTGSGNLIIVRYPDGSKEKFIVDFGLFQEEEYAKYNEKLICEPNEIDFVLVTHNHVDHTGRLPYLVKNGFNGSIYLTDVTDVFIGGSLLDSCKVLRDLARRKNTNPLYSNDDVAKTLQLIEPCSYNKTFNVTEHIKVTFLINGHLFGAAMILVTMSYEGCEDINLLFTGDYNNKNMFFDVPEVPEEIRNLKVSIVIESTYGYMNSTDVYGDFKGNILSAISDGKTVIVPVFSLGRAQEILYELRKLQEKGLVTQVPIYLDGKLAIKNTDLCRKREVNIAEDKKDFLPKNLTYVNDSSRDSILRSKKSKIIITTSGMGSYGPAQTYLPAYIGNEKALIHFTGYTAEGSLGAELRNCNVGDIVEIGGVLIRKFADVQYTSEYSAHAKADELIALLNKFPNKQLVLVTHGQTETKKNFAKKVLLETKTKSVGILGEEYIFRGNTYGLVKTMSTYFK